MLNSFNRYLDFSLLNISDDLLHPENKKSIQKLGDFLPETFAHFVFGYEKRLLDVESVQTKNNKYLNQNMDIAVSAANNLKSVYNYDSIFNFPKIEDITKNKIEWRRLKNLSDEWADKESIVNRLLEGISLEFDFSSLQNDDFIPSAFLGIESMPNIENNNQLFERLNVFISGIRILSGEEANPELVRFLHLISENLRNKYSLFQVGLMLSRKNTPVRICIKRFKINEVLPFLKSVSDDGEILLMADRTINDFGKFFDHCVLALDIIGSRITKVGLECYFNNKTQPPREKRWEKVLSDLCDNGLCSEFNKRLILEFPKKVTCNINSFFKDVNNIPEFYAQGLHHMKFTLNAENSSFAKVYLWAGYKF